MISNPSTKLYLQLIIFFLESWYFPIRLRDTYIFNIFDHLVSVYQFIPQEFKWLKVYRARNPNLSYQWWRYLTQHKPSYRFIPLLKEFFYQSCSRGCAVVFSLTFEGAGISAHRMIAENTRMCHTCMSVSHALFFMQPFSWTKLVYFSVVQCIVKDFTLPWALYKLCWLGELVARFLACNLFLYFHTSSTLTVLARAVLYLHTGPWGRIFRIFFHFYTVESPM